MVIRRATELLGRGQGRLSWPARAGSVAAGLALAQVLPEPPNRYHPVAWFGSTMERAEQRRYRDDRARGVQPPRSAPRSAPRPGSRAACSSARRP